jgi:hypothetical protein
VEILEAVVVETLEAVVAAVAATSSHREISKDPGDFAGVFFLLDLYEVTAE